jgi:peroxiredoxin Q/BCP
LPRWLTGRAFNAIPWSEKKDGINCDDDKMFFCFKPISSYGIKRQIASANKESNMSIHPVVARKVRESFQVVKNLSASRLALSVIAAGLISVGSIALSAQPASAEPVKAGEPAPDFTLKDDKGKPTSLHDFKDKVILVFFYDVDNEPFNSSTADTENTKKSFKKYKLEDTDILCIGPDPVTSHKALQSGLKLNFHLLPDKDNAVRTKWGLPEAVKGNHAHYAYVIGKDQTVKKVYGGAGSTTAGGEDFAKALRTIGDFSVSAY